MYKILSLGEPEITVYPHHAHLIAIYNGLYKNDTMKAAWFSNNYIQLEANKEVFVIDFSVAMNIIPILNNCPWLIKDSVSRALIDKQWRNITDFLIAAIDTEYYVYMEVDEFYIKEYDNYNRTHNMHSLLVYGYQNDEYKKCFYIADFFKNRKYYFTEATFEEMELAYKNFIPNNFLDGVFLYRKNFRFYIYDFNSTELKKNLSAYINSEDIMCRNMIINYTQQTLHTKNRCCFGRNIYNFLKNYISETHNIYIPSINILEAHKKILLFLIDYMNQYGWVKNGFYFNQKFEELYGYSKNISGLAIKYNITHNENNKIKILDWIHKLEEAEKPLIEELISQISDEPQFNSYKNCYIEKAGFGLNLSPGFSENNGLYLSDNDLSFAQIVFYGNKVTYYADMGPEFRQGSIVLDGDKDNDISFSLWSEKNVTKQEIFSYNFNKTGFHSLRLKVNGGSLINIHGFSVSQTDLTGSDLIPTDLKFVGADGDTQGNWIGKYGKEGYLLPSMDNVLPSYGEVMLQQVKTFTNQYVFKDNLLVTPNKMERLKTCYYVDLESLSIDVIICGDQSRKVSVYFLDWGDGSDLEASLEVYNEKKELLHKYDVRNFKEGKYITYEITGHVVFKLTYKNLEEFRTYGEFYGLFFD